MLHDGCDSILFLFSLFSCFDSLLFSFFSRSYFCSCSMAMLYVLITFWHFKRRSYYWKLLEYGFLRCAVYRNQLSRALRTLEHSDKGADMEFIYVWWCWWLVTGEKMRIELWRKNHQKFRTYKWKKWFSNFAHNFTLQFTDLRINVHLIGSKRASVPCRRESNYRRNLWEYLLLLLMSVV